MTTFPAENQQRLLLEAGLDAYFNAQWIDIGDIGEVARRLHVVSDTMVTCGLQTATTSYDPTSWPHKVWITSLTPAWSLVLAVAGIIPDTMERLSAGGHRVFEIFGDDEEMEQIQYAFDGDILGEFFAYEEFNAYWQDLSYDSLEEELEMYLCIMGRITGRFFDRDWLASQGLLGEVPWTTRP
ncbi:hypothetical protein [Bailinhaonella thermotolerans]|uniref:Uncharacterized protein n=1 Tax=Bailinhaonella thermotolerans TaxID=1070861 RepID=A0A3A4ACX8_9ACTN|nr:hypothetical protein [Bailinhaonella thermotolerans]RJL23910.1 hypothetical protein D5H75_31215 [Bailinhaonella thermotolerans]